MATTTLRVPDELKARVAELAERAGKTPHAFMLEAIEERVRLSETRAAFVEEASGRFEEMLETGRAIDWHEMREHLKERAAGRKSKPPRVRAWRATSSRDALR